MNGPDPGQEDAAPATDVARLADFVLGELLGEGSSATVHRAVHGTLQATVALKRWRRTPTENERRKFLSECRLQWRLAAEPTIVRLLWAGAAPGERPWLAMELYEGSLADRLAGTQPIETDDALRWAEDLLRGLSAVHASGHLHRDVKPGNVLIKGGHAALADLGTAMRSAAWTSDNAAGTARYMAPEVIRGAAPDFRSDVYSAGLTIEHMFRGAVPSWLDPVLVRATSYDPADRPADAAAFVRDFGAAGPRSHPAGREQAAASRSGDGAFAQVRHRWPAVATVPRGRRVWISAVLTLALAGVALSALAFEMHHGRAPSVHPPPSTLHAAVHKVSLNNCAPLSMAVPAGGAVIYVACQTPGIDTVRPVDVIDVRTWTVRALPVSAFAIALSPDGRRLYAATDHGTLDMIDVRNYAVVRSIPMDAVPDRITVSPNGRDVYVANSRHGETTGYARFVVDVDTADGSVHYLPAGLSPADVAVDGQFVLVANRYGNTVSVIDASTHKLVRTIQVGHQPERVAFLDLPGGVYAYVINAADNTVSVLDVMAGVELFTTSPVAQASAIAVDQSAAGYTYVADAVNNNVAVLEKGIQPKPRTVLALPAGHDPEELLVADNRLYVVSMLDSSVTVLPLYQD